jgi:hypothetical protein
VLQPKDTSKEYSLQLKGYSRHSRGEIVGALLTLAKHGVGFPELVNGSATGNELDEQVEPKELYLRDVVGFFLRIFL